jgi:RNA polymerase sigma-70 factor (ECF subfamily)
MSRVTSRIHFLITVALPPTRAESRWTRTSDIAAAGIFGRSCAVVARAGGGHTGRVMRASADSSDEDLMLAYAAGDAGAFDLLYARHKGGVYRYLLRQCRDAGIAEQIFQDVWMNLVRVRASYRPDARFATWIYTLAHNRLIDHHRASGRVTLLSVDDEAHADVVSALPASRGTEPESRAANRELGARLLAALGALPPAQRDAFLLQQEGALTLEEIAGVTGVGAETVKSRLRYATAKLRAELADLRPELREDTG